MNVNECANCRLHGWKQLDNEDDLLTCKRCKVIKYCGKMCQTEHWKKLHKRQCKYLADPAKAQQSKHNEDACGICLRSDSVGKREIRNPNYECFYKSTEWEKLKLSDLYHDHPFSVAGQPGNIKEKVFIVLWYLLYKFQHSQPKSFQNDLKEVLHVLLMKRLDIWQSKKTYPQPEYFRPPDSIVVEANLYEILKRSISWADPFQLLKTVDVVHKIGVDEDIRKMASSFKDPLTTLPNDLRNLVWMALNNAGKFTAMANQVLEALAYQAIPYQEVLKIICGGSLQQTCSLCSKEVIITGTAILDNDGPIVFFDSLFMGFFVCGVGACSATIDSMRKDLVKVAIGLTTAMVEREANRCDFCFLLSPAEDVHRCSRCCTTMYCSKTCQLEDWKIHKEVCNKEEEERKIKFGEEERREEAREAREDLKERIEKPEVKEACEMLENFGFKKAQKNSKKKSK